MSHFTIFNTFVYQINIRLNYCSFLKYYKSCNISHSQFSSNVVVGNIYDVIKHDVRSKNTFFQITVVSASFLLLVSNLIHLLVQIFVKQGETLVFLPQLFELLRQTSTTHLIVFILFKLFYQVILSLH